MSGGSFRITTRFHAKTFVGMIASTPMAARPAKRAILSVTQTPTILITTSADAMTGPHTPQEMKKKKSAPVSDQL